MKRSRIREIASSCVLWTGMGLIGIIAIPAGILLGIIYGIVMAVGFLTDKIERG